MMPQPMERIIICRTHSGTISSIGVTWMLVPPRMTKYSQKHRNITNCMPKEINPESAVAIGETRRG